MIKVYSLIKGFWSLWEQGLVGWERSPKLTTLNRQKHVNPANPRPKSLQKL